MTTKTKEIKKKEKRVVYDFPVAIQPIYTQKQTQCPNHRAVVRTDTGRVLGVVGSKYNLVKNTDLLNQLEESLPVAVGNRQINLADNGAIMFVNYTSPKIDNVEVRKGDIVRFGIQVFNSYNGKLAVGMRLQAYRLACENGMTVPRSVSTLHIRHVHGVTSHITGARETFNKRVEEFVKYKNVWKKWGTIKAEPVLVEKFSKQYLGAKSREVVRNKYEADQDDTVWGFFNAVTWFGTHVLRTKTYSEAVPVEERLENLTFKQFAYDRTVTERFYRFKWSQ